MYVLRKHKTPFKDLKDPFKDLKDPFKDLKDLSKETMFTNIVSVSNNVTNPEYSLETSEYEGYDEGMNEQSEMYIEHPIGSLVFSAYHYHSNRNPFYVLFIKNGSLIYIEMMNEYTRRHKIVEEIVMPFNVMEKNENLKKLYDLSVMMVNTDKSIYYDTVGVATKQLIQTYDTDSEEDECDEKPKPVVRHWCISCDTVWKDLRVSKSQQLNCYYNIDPFSYEYEVDSERNINGFMRCFDAFIKYNKVPPAIEQEIVANYEYSVGERLERS